MQGAMGVHIVKFAGCLIWLHFDSPMYNMTAYPPLQDPRPSTEPDYLVLASKHLSWVTVVKNRMSAFQVIP